MTTYCDVCGKYYCDACMQLHDHMTHVTGFGSELVSNNETGWEKYMRRHGGDAEDLNAKIIKNWRDSHRKRAKKSTRK